MKKLLLLRHAKSDRPAGLEDFDRPLNAKGRRAAPKMAEAMLARDYIPDAVLVSPAQRTRETWQLMAPILNASGHKAEFVEEIYLASANRILSVVRHLGPEAKAALIVGHNPGIEDIATRLASDDQSFEGKTALEQLKRKYPTCALTVLAFAIKSWTDLSPGTGAIVEFLTPSSLED